jgi:Bacterial mobilisation protein (MobC)
MEKNKGGRPPAGDKKKGSRIGIALSETDKIVLQEKANATGYSLSEYCARLLVNGNILQRYTEEDRVAIRSLTGIANNINQLAYACHVGGIVSVENHLRETLAELDKILSK